jgi:hypothetical protein
MPTIPHLRLPALAALAAITAGTLAATAPAAVASSADEPAAAPAPAAAPGHSGHAGGSHGKPGLTAAQRHVIRKATARYRDVNAAVAAGYAPTDECVADPTLGGMGYHYVHPQLAADRAIDPTLPEVLVYAPDAHGHRHLVAIEYFMADADGDLNTDDDRPTLFGHRFNGPMEGHGPGMPVHYDIHAWVWKHNPAGELADFNPHVTCPTS